MASLPNLSESDVQSEIAAGDVAGMIPMASMGNATTFKKIYYRREDGRIALGGYWPQELMRQLSLGRQPMMQYGEHGEDVLMNGKFEPILRRGGAKEFPLEQIIELGWHKPKGTPRIDGRPVVFPQLDTDEARELISQEKKCGYCHKPYPDEARLTNHQRVAHRDVSQQASLARALGDVMKPTQAAAPVADTGDAMIALLTKLVERVEALEKRPAK